MRSKIKFICVLMIFLISITSISFCAVNIDDLAKLKLHLIGTITLKNEDYLNADLDSDNLLTINDLAKMKLLLINGQEYYEKYLNEIADSLGSLEDAVKNNKVTKYQFTYQINGTLKNNFEKQINEKLDYSKDRFYLIKNENTFGKTENRIFDLDNKMFIYNPYRKTITEIPKDYTLTKKKATWYWRSSNEFNKKVEDNEEFQNEFFDSLVTNYQISDIYLHLGPSFFRNSHSATSFNLEKLKTFVQNAYEHNIRVYCLIGDVSYLLDENIQKTIYDLFDDIEKYNNSVDVKQRIAGVSYDNKFWVVKKDSKGNVILDLEWKTNEATRKKHIKYISDASDYAKEKNLDVNFAFNFNIPRYTYTDDNGQTVNMYDAISKILEEPILMIYRDSIDQIYKYINDVQTDATESILAMSLRNGSSINVAIDTAPHTEELNSQTFYEEESENFGINGAINTNLNNLGNKFKNNNHIDSFIFSIHHAETIAKFFLK